MTCVPTIYFIRHGETDWNATRRYQGQADIPMNDKGRAQAQRNGDALREFLPDIASASFVASPLQRTLETMRIVRTALGLEPDGFATEPRLMELNYGGWQGQLASELHQTDPEGLAKRIADPMNWRARGGENYIELSQRVEAWLKELERSCVVVSHGGVSRVLRRLLVGGIAEEDIFGLEVPQDRIMILAQGVIRWH